MSAFKDQAAETVLGAIVAVVAIGFLTFAVTRAGAGEASGGYPLTARFNRVDGVNVGADVRLSGVKVGTVSAVAVDPKTYLAKLTLSVSPSVKLPDDSTARVASDGLLGGAYVALDPGGSAEMLASGAEIVNTTGTVDLLSLLAAAAGNAGAATKEDEEAIAP
jgi:phospholipid/cholesterol/gamma-HCH transport system substrate-binding protein